MKPLPYLEIGGSHLVLFGGPGRRDLSFSEILETLYSNTNQDNAKTDSNQEFALDVALTLPGLQKYLGLIDGVKLYCEIGAEDTGIPPDRRAYIAGAAFYKPFGIEQAVLRGEYAMLSPNSVPNAWYNHSYYPMRYDGRVFGHHVGSDAEDFFLEWSQSFEKLSYKIGFDRERSGIKTKTNPQSKNQYFLEAGWRFNLRYGINLRYVYEDIRNADYAQDEKQRNHFVGVETNLYF
jgi:hypothetical protein